MDKDRLVNGVQSLMLANIDDSAYELLREGAPSARALVERHEKLTAKGLESMIDIAYWSLEICRFEVERRDAERGKDYNG